jgi:hypothetical protein
MDKLSSDGVTDRASLKNEESNGIERKCFVLKRLFIILQMSVGFKLCTEAASVLRNVPDHLNDTLATNGQ